MNVLLSDEHIQLIITGGVMKHAALAIPYRRQAIDRDIATAQIKAIIEYMEEPCTEHPDLPSKSKGDPRIFLGGPRHRYLCFDCWQQMKRGAGC